MADPRGFTALSEMEQLKRKQTLERAKANYLSSQLKLRLQYARLKVDHGWQGRTLGEVENLYFRHTHKKPALSRTDNVPDVQGTASSTTLSSAQTDSGASGSPPAVPALHTANSQQSSEVVPDSNNTLGVTGTSPGSSSAQDPVPSSSRSPANNEPSNPPPAAPDTDVTMTDATKAPSGKRTSKKSQSRAKTAQSQAKNGTADTAPPKSTAASSSTNDSASNSQQGSTTTTSRRGGRSRASYKRESYSPSMFASTPSSGASYDSFWQSHSSTSQSYRHLLSQNSASTSPSMGTGEAPAS